MYLVLREATDVLSCRRIRHCECVEYYIIENFLNMLWLGCYDKNPKSCVFSDFICCEIFVGVKYF